MANHLEHMFKNVFEEFKSLTQEPELFLKPTPDKCSGFKNVTKQIYDAVVQANPLTELQSKSLPKLLIDGFDDEQIWQQIELQNRVAISHLEHTSSKIDVNSLSLLIDAEKNVPNGDSNDKASSLDEDEYKAMEDTSDVDMDGETDDDEYADVPDNNKRYSEEEEMNDDDLDDEELNEDNLEDQEESDNLDDDDSDEYIDFEKKSTEKTIKNPTKEILKSSKKGFITEVDDQFFKLSNLEKFLRLEDLKEERSWDENKSEDEKSDDDDDIDLFEDIPSSEDDSEEEADQANGVKKSSKDLMYNDFFDAPESGDENAESKDLSDEDYDDKDFDEGDIDEGDIDQSDGDNSEETINTNKPQNEEIPLKNSKNKTPFQIQLEKTKEQIALFEKGLLEPAPWHLTGEVDALKRPSDGLLDLQTDFEVNARPVVIEDKPLCEKLEDMLKNTIKNKAYSDGVRQYKTNKEVIAQKKEIILEQNKSSKSLAQEYEDMYLKQKHNPEEEENPKHIAIKKLRDSLFPELLALFSHIPKPAVPDLKVVSNLPAITVEEVAPTSVSDVTLLAPEEIKKRSGLVKGVTERESTDKKRERRKKKAFQKMKAKKREQESGDNPASGKLKKKEKLETLRKLKQNRNTKIASVDGKRIKSSKDFFAQLQETMDTNTKQTSFKKKSK